MRTLQYLSLPLPSTTMRIVEIIVWKLDNITWPVKYAFSIASTDYVRRASLSLVRSPFLSHTHALIRTASLYFGRSRI